jgi:UDP-glucose 4-epimerase
MHGKLLVVGGTGFIGFHIAKEGIRKGLEVYSLSKNPPPTNRYLDEVKYIYINLLDEKKLSNFLKNLDINYVVNSMGYVDHKLIKNGGNEVFENHFSASKNLIFSLNRKYLKCFLQLGSSDEYGDNPSPQIEELRESPISPYSFAKVATCHMLQMLNKTEKFPASILRLFLVYGPNQNKERFLPFIINESIKNKEYLVSPGEQIRDFCYVDDIVRAIFIALNKKRIFGEILNIASGEPMKINRMVNLVVEILHKGKPIIGGIKYRDNESMNLYASVKKAKDLLGWEPQISLEEGLTKTIEYYKDNG